VRDERTSPHAAPATGSGAMRYTLCGLAAVVCWLLVGELGIAARERWALPTALVALRRYGASDTSISLLLSVVPAVISLFLVPYIGFRSDRFRSRWGRRRPYLVASALAGTAAMLCVAFSPAIAGQVDAVLGGWSPGADALELAFFCLSWTTFDCAAITTAALFTGLVNDVLPHSFIGRFFAIFRIVGLLVAISFNVSVLALTDHYLREVLVAIALVFGLAIVLMCLVIREGDYPDRAADDDMPGSRLTVACAHVVQCFTQRHYLWAFASFTLAAMTFGPFNTFSQSYALDLGIPKAELGSLTASCYAVSIATAFGIGWLADRFGAVRVSALMMGLYFVIAACGCVLVHDAGTFRCVYCAHVIMSGAYFTAASSMPMDLFPRSEFVRYNSSKDIMVAFANILLGASIGPMLDLSGHDYRLTLATAVAFSLLSLLCMGRLLAHPSPMPADASPALRVS
jgi:MFS family permease